MDWTNLLVALALVLLVTSAVVASWTIRKRCSIASTASDGVQEVEIVVRGHYRPSRIVVSVGRPARLLFNRQEATPCSERVIFSDFQQEQHLAAFATTPVQFIPTRTGEYLFTCAMGMYQGRLLVEDARETGPSPLVSRIKHQLAANLRLMNDK